MLTDDSNAPLADQSVQLVFRIYNSESGGALQWTETHNATTNSIGVVSVILGETTPLPPASFGVPLWLEVQANGEIMLPRRELVSAPYTLHAHDSDNLGGSAASAYATDAELSTPGSINAPANPVDWTKLKSVPAGFADGTDDAGGVGDGYSLDASDGSPVDAVYVNAVGDVGIGTTAPTRNVQIHGSGNSSIKFTNPATGATASDGLDVGASSDGSAYIWNIESTNLVLGSSNMPMLTLSPSNDAIQVGGPYTWHGDLEVYGSGMTSAVVEIGDVAYGGTEKVRDEAGNTAVLISADDSGTGGLVHVAKDATYNVDEGIDLNGNWGNLGEPALRVLGTDRSAFFSMYASGNSSVQLPSDAIADTEILDEPGVAHNESSASFAIEGPGYDIITSRSITVPASGYVLAIGTCGLKLSHGGSVNSSVILGMSTSATSLPGAQAMVHDIPSALPAGSYQYVLSSHGLFSVTAGMHTFYYLVDEGYGDWWVDDSVITLAYFPTAYGTVAVADGDGTEVEVGAPLTPADIAAEQAEAREFSLARLERELAEVKAQLDAMKAEGATGVQQ